MSSVVKGEEVSLWTYLTVLLRRRYLVALLPVALAAVVGISSLLSPRQYTASASFIPQESGATQSSLSQLASQFGLSVARPSAGSPQFYADLLQTRDLLSDVASTRYSLTGDRAFTGDLIDYLKIRTRNREMSVALAVSALREMISVQTDRVTGVISFEVNTRDAGLSLQIADRLLALLNDYNLRRRQTQARAEREFVEQRLAQAKDSLAAAEQVLSGFLSRNRRVGDSPQLMAEQQRLERQVALQQQIFLSLAQSYEAAKIEEVRNTPVITVVDRPEGFVEPRARGTVRKVILALFSGLVLAIAAAFFLDYLARQRRYGSEGYGEFVTMLGSAATDLGRFRRRSR